MGSGVAVGSGVGVGSGVAVGSGVGVGVGADSVKLPQAVPATITIASATDIAHGFEVILIDPKSVLLPDLSPFPVVARSIIASPVTVNTDFSSYRAARLKVPV